MYRKNKEIEMKVISIANKKGGVGKTTIAQNLCVFLQNNMKNFIAIDLDSQQQLSKFSENREQNLGKGFEVSIPSSEEELEKIISTSLDNNVKYCILDLGGYDSEISRIALLLSDIIIIPLSNTSNDIDGFGEFLYSLNTMLQENDSAKVLVALNRIHHADKKAKQRLKQDIEDTNFLKNVELCENQIPSSKELVFQLDTGKTPLDSRLPLGVGKILEEFCSEILKA